MKKVIKTSADMLTGPQWIIIEFETQSVYVEGDERSRTNPGHGYPAHTDTFETNKITAYDNIDEWRADCELLMLAKQHRSYGAPKSFTAFHVDAVAQFDLKPVVKI